MPPQIRNIIFDLGGVILNIDYQLTEQAFRELGAERFEEIFSQLQQEQLFDDFETGRITAQQFRDRLRETVQHDLTDRQIDTAWNKMLLDLPVQRLRILEQLRENYCLFLLSNTNDLHLERFHEIIRQQHSLEGMEPYFEAVYYSNHVGMRKPDREIFEHILEENDLKPSETLFIDDSPQHVEGARQCGLQGKHLKESETIEQWVQGTEWIGLPDGKSLSTGD